jgi:nucleoside-diphosphate-sugar epimerase
MLPGGRRFYRRWRIAARRGAAAVAIHASFAPGFPEYRLHARGALGSATADLERDTYRLSLHSAWSPDLDRFREGVRGAAGQAAQAARNLAGYALAKLGLSRHGNLFELSIARAVEAFYRGLDRPGEPDPRISARRGARIVELGRALAEQSGVKNPPPPPPRPAPRARAAILVLGGSGFIGRELVGQLLARGRGVRVLSRGADDPLPASPLLERMQGSFLDPGALDRALDGIEVVYHLARSYGPTWEDFQREEIGGAQRVGEQCLKHAVRRLVYTGTIDSYYAGAGAGPITERTPLDPQLARRNLYARAKGAAEEALRALERERGLPLVVARPGIVIGRGGSPMHGGVGLWQGLGVVSTWGGGRTPLPFVMVEDCADALARMADAPGIEGRVLLLVGPPLLGAREYLDELERCGGLRLQRSAAAPWRLYLDDVAKWLVKVAVRHPGRSRRPSYRDFASRTHAAPYDCAETRAALGWTPCAERAELVEKGIRAPLRELLG